MGKLCLNCGSENDIHAKFCSECGSTQFEYHTATPVTQAPAQIATPTRDKTVGNNRLMVVMATAIVILLFIVGFLAVPAITGSSQREALRKEAEQKEAKEKEEKAKKEAEEKAKKEAEEEAAKKAAEEKAAAEKAAEEAAKATPTYTICISKRTVYFGGGESIGAYFVLTPLNKTDVRVEIRPYAHINYEQGYFGYEKDYPDEFEYVGKIVDNEKIEFTIDCGERIAINLHGPNIYVDNIDNFTYESTSMVPMFCEVLNGMSYEMGDF